MEHTYRLKDGVIRYRAAGLKLDREDPEYPNTVDLPEDQAEQHSDVLTLHKSADTNGDEDDGGED